MDKLKLEIPRQNLNPSASALANPGRLKAWLAALPLGNANKTGHELLAALHPINRAKIPLNHRYALLEQTRPLITNLLEILHKQYTSAPVPLADKPRAVADMVRALLLEMTYGYKAVILELAAAPSSNEAMRTALINAAYQVVVHLSRLMVETYAIYAPEPKKLWLEVNQLYLYAERNGFHTTAAGAGTSTTAANGRSLDHAYRRLLLITLANPYRLMQGETLQVYQELDSWVPSCRLLPMAPGTSPKGLVFVDLEGDAPPRYAPASFDIPPPADGRAVEIAPILAQVEQRIKEVMLAHKTEAGQLTLLGRQLRNMYKRLAEAWGVRSERLAERKQRSAAIDITVGISACHYFSSGGADFLPEAREIELLHGNSTSGSNLSLVDVDDAPWLNQDRAKRLVTGIVQPRTSHFSPENALDKDVWVKVYSTQAQHDHKKGEGLSYESFTCRLVDESRSGIAIARNKEHQMRLNVGEVVGFKTDDARSTADWSIGTVRWLRITLEGGLDLGIRTLADDALAVAVRGVRGAGKGGEYFRALLIPRLDPLQYPTTLITPAAIFDIDSIVLINAGDKLLYAHLARQMDATNAYSLFQFQVVPSPEMEATPSGNDHWIL